MKKQKTEKLNTNKGITLIALVITIIVMLILVAVTISMAINGGLFEYARNAGTQTNEAVANEQLLASGQVTIGETTYNSIGEYLGTETDNGTYDETAKDVNGMLIANATYKNGGYTAVIPKGFAIVPGLNGTTAIVDGLVITDEIDAQGNSIGNEFVWIPVTVTETDTETSIASFYRSQWENNARVEDRYFSRYVEPYANGYTNEIAEYDVLVKSVYDNGGFYIGRYEAGSTTARTDEANGTTEMVVKRDAYPYNFVGWGLTMSNYTSEITHSGKNQGKGALLLSKELYGTEEDKGKYGVTSTLCYGILWDAMLDFIKDETHNVTDSTTWGNYYKNAWTITRKTAKYTTSPKSDTTWSLIDDETNDKKEKTASEGILLTTGASDDFAAKNIFDVAGNCGEWTNETDASGSYDIRVIRGR